MKLLQDEVAIIGMAGIFPDAPNLEAFWENILASRCSITDHPAPLAQELLDPGSDAFERIYSIRGGYLRDLARFNPAEHGVLPNTVPTGDPDQFLGIQVATEALEDAGLGPGSIPGERTAVILGHGSYFNTANTLWFQRGLALDETLRILRQLLPELSDAETQRLREYLNRSLPAITPQTPPTMLPNVVAGRIANRLDLMGPNYIIDGACASTLIALDHAMKGLLLDECDLVISGGVQACVPPVELMLFCALQALSRLPALRPFDRQADGTMLGEGLGVVVLKRRRDAERDGNRVYAILKAVGTASDGRARALMAPRLEGGALAMRRAYERGAVDPASVALIEAHGTGIPLGDQTEIAALLRTFGPRQGRYPTVAIGSVKSNIGHCRPAAAAAGLIKMVLSLHHRVLPPTASFETPHPDLGMENTPFYINREARPWIHGDPVVPRRAAVNALGFGGIDSHCILEEYRGA